MASMSEERLLLQSDKGCRIVSPDEFVGMMISHHSLTRADEPAANLIGLRDESTGIRVLVAEEDLLQIQSRKPHLN